MWLTVDENLLAWCDFLYGMDILGHGVRIEIVVGAVQMLDFVVVAFD